MFSLFWDTPNDDFDDDDDDASSVESKVPDVPAFSYLTDETPGTLAYFKAWKDRLETQLVFPNAAVLLPLWTRTLESSQAARQSLVQATAVLDELQKIKADAAQIAQAQKAVNQATTALEECNKTVKIVAQSLLTTTTTTNNDDAIPAFLAPDFDDSAWVTFIVLQNPQHWASWCCPNGNDDNPDAQRVAMATAFLLEVDKQRLVLAAGGPRNGNFANYLEILPQLDSSAAKKEPVLERLAQAVALELADKDLFYFDTTEPLDPLARYLHYEQAYLMGDLDPAFSTLGIFELRMAIRSPQQEWELQWGRQALQTYRPDWALTTDLQWRYCFLVRLDVGYMEPTYSSYPRTMDQVLSGGGECGPRAWFGRFMCQAFGIPTWGYKQVGHAAMSHWTENGWVSCLGAGFPYAFWEDRCGLDFYLETQVRDQLSTPLAYLQKVMRLEWLALYKQESNHSILGDCTYDPAAPWYALSLAHREILAAASRNSGSPRCQKYPRSTRTVPKILAMQRAQAQSNGVDKVTLRQGEICIPAAATITDPSDKVVAMPSFTGGNQVFLGTDAILDFALESHWLPVSPRKYKMTVKVATAHVKDTALLVTVKQKKMGDQKDGDSYRLRLPYTKALWEETESVEITLCSSCASFCLQREWTEMYGISLKEIRLVPFEPRPTATASKFH